jgi:hypothetical protein
MAKHKDDDKVTLTKEELEVAAKEFFDEVQSGYSKLAEQHKDTIDKAEEMQSDKTA